MMSQTQGGDPVCAFRIWVRLAGIYNLISSLPVAIPYFIPFYYRTLNTLNRALGLGGGEASAPADAATRLMVSTSGLMLSLVGALLLWSSADLAGRWAVPLLNAVTRVIFATTVVFLVVSASLPRLFLGFAATDLLFAVAFVILWIRLRRPESSA